MDTERALLILPAQRRLSIKPGQSLLEASLSASAGLRSACRNGTCRACMARLITGQVHYRVEWPGLSAEEKAEGWVLPCVAVPDSDIVLCTDP